MKLSNNHRLLISLTVISILWAAIALTGCFDVLAHIQKLIVTGGSLADFGSIATSMNLVAFSMFACFAIYFCAVVYCLYSMFAQQEGFNKTLTEMDTRMQDQQQILRQLLRAYYAEKSLDLTGKVLPFSKEISK